MNQRGFSVLEMLIAFALFMIALLAVGTVFDSNRRSYVRGEVAVDVQQNARLAVSEIAREIRMAGFYPENYAIPAASPALANPIQLATDSALAVYGDVENSGTSSVFLYCLDGTTLRRGRAPQGDISAYWCPATDLLAENVAQLRFTYYGEDDLPIPDPPGATFQLDGQDVGSVPDLSIVTNRSAVRRIAISLSVQEPVPGHGIEVYELGSEVLLRNVSDGFALVISLVLLLLLTVLGVSLLSISRLESNISHNDQWSEGALHAAEAGVHAAIDQLGIDPAPSTAPIPETILLADYSFRSGSRLAGGPEPLRYIGKLRAPGYALGVGTGYNPRGFSFSRYGINATGIAPRNTRREVEALADYGPFPE